MLNRLASTTNGYKGSSLERALQGIASVGLKYVELAAIPGHCEHVTPEKMGKAEVAGLRRMLAVYGLEAVSISGHVDLTSVSGVEALKRRIDLASELEVTIVNTGTGEAETHEEKEDFFRNISDAAEYAGSRCVTIALETHGGLTGTGPDCLATMERIGSEWVRINYDPANVIYYRGVSPEEDIKAIAPHLAHFHIKDQIGGQGVPMFPPVGQGIVDFKAIFTQLKKVGYNGPLSFEVELDYSKFITDPDEEDKALQVSLDYVRRVMDSV
jgi:sugar phosphate isomerase/epimerase